MIPELDPDTGYLPVGDHDATLAEVGAKFTNTLSRVRLFEGLQEVVKQLGAAGVEEIYIDGSFCTSKPIPNDIDGYWIYTPGVDLTKIDPCLVYPDKPAKDQHTGELAREMKLRYGVEFFPWTTNSANQGGTDFPSFFRVSRDGVPRGIIRLRKERDHD